MGSDSMIAGGKPFDLFLQAAGTCTCSNGGAVNFFNCGSPASCSISNYTQPSGTLACVLPTASPTRAPTEAPTQPPTQLPTQVPTQPPTQVRPPTPPTPSPTNSPTPFRKATCTSDSLYASSFTGASVFNVATDQELDSALLLTTTPRIINLVAPPGSTYTINVTYTLSSSRRLCIQVRRKESRERAP